MPSMCGEGAGGGGRHMWRACAGGLRTRWGGKLLHGRKGGWFEEVDWWVGRGLADLLAVRGLTAVVGEGWLSGCLGERNGCAGLCE